MEAFQYGMHTVPRNDILYNYYLKVDKYATDYWMDVPVALRNHRYKLIHAFVGNPTSYWYDADGAALTSQDTPSDAAAGSQAGKAGKKSRRSGGRGGGVDRDIDDDSKDALSPEDDEEDDDGVVQGTCSQVDASQGVFTRFLFDLDSDPNEQINLYDANERLYGGIKVS